MAKWYEIWNENPGLAFGGVEISFRKGQISTLGVETDAVKKSRQITNHLCGGGISPRYYVVGERGYGKSSILNIFADALYRDLEKDKPVPAYCSMISKGEEEKNLEAAFYNSVLNGLFEIPHDLKKHYSSRRSHLASIQNLRQAENDFNKTLLRLGEVSPDFIYRTLQHQLRMLSEDFCAIALLVDGLDKYDPDVVLRFLRRSQEDFNAMINKYNVFFFYAADPTWVNILESSEFTGVKGTRIQLRRWTTDEASRLMRKRLEAKGIFLMPFETEALDLMVTELHGNPRRILLYTDILLDYAAKKQIEHIGPGLIKDVVWTDDKVSKLHERIAEYPLLRYAYEKLRPVISFPAYLAILVGAYSNKNMIKRMTGYTERATLGIDMDDAEFDKSLDFMLDKGCLKLGETEKFLLLEDDVYVMMKTVHDIGGSFEALPVVFEEFEAQVRTPPPPPPEEVLVKDAVKSVITSHPREWLDVATVSSYIRQDSRKINSLRQRFGDKTENTLDRVVPLIIGRMKKDGELISDDDSGKVRWKGSLIPKDLAGVVRERSVAETLEQALDCLEREDMEGLPRACRKPVVVSIESLVSTLGKQPSKLDLWQELAILTRLGIDVLSPVSLETYLTDLTAKAPPKDSSSLLIDLCKLYVRRIQDKGLEVAQKGVEEFVLLVQDPDYYAVMKDLENSLRQLLVDQLGRVDPYWMKKIDPVARANWQDRKERRRKPYPWLESVDLELIYFADFPDYVQIITNRGNWDLCFEEVLKDKVSIEAKLRELEPIRNDIAHSRNITKEQEGILRLYAKQIITMIDSHQKKQTLAPMGPLNGLGPVEAGAAQAGDNAARDGPKS